MPFDSTRCSIFKTLELVGDRWSILILREVSLYEVTRFAELQQRLGISRAVLSERLDGLVEHGILERVPYQPPGERARHEYRLTEAGTELFPVLIALGQWGDKHRNQGLPPIDIEHSGCGELVHAQLVCDAGHPVTQRETEPHPGPGITGKRTRTARRSGRAGAGARL